MNHPYPPPQPRRGWHPLVWVAIGLGACLAIPVLIAVAIPVYINLTGGPSGTDPKSVAPNVGASALHVGELRRGGSADTSVLAVRKYPPRKDRPAVPGTEWLGIRAKVCWHDDATQATTTALTWQSWMAVDAAGKGYLPGGVFDDYPTPQFPRVATVRPGQCDQGWILTPVPIGGSGDIVKVVLTADGVAAAEWLT